MTKIKYQEYGKYLLNVLISAAIIGISFLFDRLFTTIASDMQYPLLSGIFYLFTLLGELYIFAGITLVLTVILFINRKPLVSFLSGILAAAIVNTMLKEVVNRMRPFEAMHSQSLVNTTLSSFPSGHATAAFAILPVMCRNFPRIKTVLWTIAVLVAISRIYFNVHYFSDVVAGAMIGYSIGWLFMKIGEHNDWK